MTGAPRLGVIIYEAIGKMTVVPEPAKAAPAPVGCTCKTSKTCTFVGEHVCCCGALSAGCKERPGHSDYCRYRRENK